MEVTDACRGDASAAATAFNIETNHYRCYYKYQEKGKEGGSTPRGEKGRIRRGRLPIFLQVHLAGRAYGAIVVRSRHHFQ